MMLMTHVAFLLLMTAFVSSGEEKCGFDAIVGGQPPTSRILNTDTARPCQWPWMVSVRRTGRKEMCSGVLVGRKKVLTTARCAKALENLGGNFEVVVGEYNIEIEGEKDNLGRATEVIIPITTMAIHPDFDPVCLSNDVAVVKLEQEVEYGSCALPVCMTTARSGTCDEYNEECAIAGWGKYKAVSAQRSPKLRWAYTTIMGPDSCNAIYQYGLNTTLPKSIFCLSNTKSKQPACLGDEGGMVVCNDKGTWLLKGLISLGSCDGPLPSLAVDLANPAVNEFIVNN